jgi:hypothetical protein
MLARENMQQVVARVYAILNEKYIAEHLIIELSQEFIQLSHFFALT